MNKKLKEVALHEKDTGSSEAQIVLLTDKIENLSAHMKKFKKDKLHKNRFRQRKRFIQHGVYKNGKKKR